MRSGSEIRWVRVRNNVGQATKVSDWHAIIPGHGADAPPPGVACETALTGSMQFETHTGVQTKDGKIHGACRTAADRWIRGLPKNPGPVNPEPDHEPLARPDNDWTDGSRRTPPDVPVQRVPVPEPKDAPR